MALDVEKLVFQLAIKGVDPAEADAAARMTGDQLLGSMRQQYERLRKAHAEAEKARTTETDKATKARVDAEVKAAEKQLSSLEKVRRAHEIEARRSGNAWRRLLEDLENVTTVLGYVENNMRRTLQAPGNAMQVLSKGYRELIELSEKSLSLMKNNGLEGTQNFRELEDALGGVKGAVQSFYLALVDNGALREALLFTKEFIDEAQRFFGIIPMSLQLRKAMMEGPFQRRGTRGPGTEDAEAVPSWLNKKPGKPGEFSRREARFAQMFGKPGGGTKKKGGIAPQDQAAFNIMMAQATHQYASPTAEETLDLRYGGEQGLDKLMEGAQAGQGLEADLAGIEAKIEAARDQLAKSGIERGGVMSLVLFGEEGEDGWQDRVTGMSAEMKEMFADVATAGDAFAGAVGNAMAAAISGEGSFTKVLREQTRQIMISLSQQAFAKAAMESAMGFAAVALGGPVGGVTAAAHFKAAAAFAAVGTAAGLGARAVGSGGGGGGAGPTVTRPVGRFGEAGSTADAARSGGGAQNTSITISIGNIYPGGEAEAGRQITRALDAYKSKYGAARA